MKACNQQIVNSCDEEKKQKWATATVVCNQHEIQSKGGDQQQQQQKNNLLHQTLSSIHSLQQLETALKVQGNLV